MATRCVRIYAARNEPPSDGRFLQDKDRDRGDDDHHVERQRHAEEFTDAELVERRGRLLRESPGDIHGDPQHQRIHADGGDQRVDAQQRDEGAIDSADAEPHREREHNEGQGLGDSGL